MQNKNFSHLYISVFSVLVVFLFLLVPFCVHAENVTCSDGSNNCGFVTYDSLVGDCTYFGQGGGSEASSYTGIPDTGTISCTTTELGLPQGPFSSGNYTAEIFSQPANVSVAESNDAGGEASFGGSSASVSPDDTTSSCSNNSLTNSDDSGTAGAGDYLQLSVSSLPLGCIPFNGAGATYTILTGSAVMKETDCLKSATSAGQPGGYVPTDNGVCTFVPTNPPPKPLAGISVSASPSSITLTPGQTSVTIDFTYYNPNAGSQLNVTSSGCGGGAFGGGLTNFDVGTPTCTPYSG